ncbi:hypothetical protein ACSBR2_032573 [Camellia fascicularis]
MFTSFFNVTRMLSKPDSPKQSSSNPVSNLIRSIFSYDNNIMLAAIISLLLVILFVLILHIYAKWFLAHARHRSRTSVSVSHVLGSARFHHFNTLTFETISPTKGLEASVIASIPLFVHESSDHDRDHGGWSECVICLCAFEEEDVGRKLPGCGHAFHVECIDMWLHSHSSCPICRAAVAIGCEEKVADTNWILNDVNVITTEDSELEIVVEVSN